MSEFTSPQACAAWEPPRSLTDFLNLTMSGYLILLVEDHVSARFTLTKLLELRGHTVVTARTAEEGEMLVNDFPFRAVVTDIGLPDDSGWEFRSRVRQEKPKLPFIAISAYGSNADLERSRAEGFFAHLIKPVKIEALEAAIEAAVGGDPGKA
jgi:CheY-like chemotaxis protein